MPFAKAQGKRLRLGEGGGDRPAERLFSTAPHSSVQCATVDRACPGCKVCSSQKSSCAGASGNHSEAKAVSDMLPTFDKPE